MVFKRTGLTGGGPSQLGGQDWDHFVDYMEGVADVENPDINSNTSYRSGRLRKRGTGGIFYYIEDTAAITADRHVAEPLLAANDTRLYQAAVQPITNKTINVPSNTVTNIGDANIAAHTSTKISILSKSLLNTSIGYQDQANTWAGIQKMEVPIKLKPGAIPTTDSSYGQLWPDSGNSNALTYRKPDGSVVVLGSGSGGGGGVGTTGPAIYIPLFVYPNWYAGASYNWTPLINAISTYPSLRFVVTINVFNGPDTSANTDYRDHGLLDLRNAANAAGTDLKILGYVFTSYAERSQALVETDIDRWFAFYPGQLDGIFFDEMEYVPGQESYYVTETAYVKSKAWAGIVWGNPGTTSTTGYAATVDTIMVVETDNGSRPNTAQMFTRTFSGAFPNSKSAVLIYNQASFDAAYVDSTIVPYVGYYEATNDVLSNPYDTLPTYLNTECAKLASLTTSGGASSSAAFITMASDGSLPSERVLTAGGGISLTDGGPNSTVTLASKNRVITRLVAEQDVVNTTTETDILAYSVPAGTLGTDKALRVQILADHANSSGSARTFTLRIKYGATTMYSDASVSIPSGVTRRPIWIDLILFAKNSATSQGVLANIKTGHATTPTTGLGNFGATDTTDLATGTVIGVNAAENSALAKTLSVTIQHSAAASTISFRRLYAVVEVLD